MKNQLRLFLVFLITVSLWSCDKDEVVEPEFYEDCKPTVVEPDLSKVDDETGLIEFDIIPTPRTKSQMKGAVVTDGDLLWDKGIVPYFIQGDRETSQGTLVGIENEEEKERIRAALAELSDATGILFIEYENRDSLKVEHNDGISIGRGLFASSSYLGRAGGLQGLYLAFDVPKATIQHEFMHALGVNHEFTRHDRDEYVDVIYENIPESYHRQFEIRATNKDCGQFDISSIMMYGSYQIQNDPDKPEMLLKDGRPFVRSLELSPVDIKTVKSLYEDEIKERDSQ